jgi:acyl carrier protein
MQETAAITWEGVRDVVAETLGVDVDEVTPDSNFFSDLGGESIDLLDLGFRCQKAFGVSPQFTSLTAFSWDLGPDGRLTDESRQRIEDAFPAIAGKLPDGPFHWQQLCSIAAIHQLIAVALRESIAV